VPLDLAESPRRGLVGDSLPPNPQWLDGLGELELYCDRLVERALGESRPKGQDR